MDLSTLFAAETWTATGPYQWKLALVAFFAAMLIPRWIGKLLLRAEGMRHIQQLNQEAAVQRMSREAYREVNKRNAKWGLVGQLAIYALAVPFVVTAAAQPWWRVPLDVFAILMFYDFFYYLTHRFIFHDNGFFGGPLLSVHAVHHKQFNPARIDASYLNPIENVIGTGLFAFSVAAIGLMFGGLHLVTVIVAGIGFMHINQHNHNLMEVDRAPYRYLKYASDMHHVHHRKFNAGNYASITLFYDWLFGTYDTGSGWGKNKKGKKSGPAQAAGAETLGA